jgi:hypothetical protein
MPADVRVHASVAVMPLEVVIQVRMKQRRAHSRQMQGGGRRNRDDRSQHPFIVGDSGHAVKRMPRR